MDSDFPNHLLFTVKKPNLRVLSLFPSLLPFLSFSLPLLILTLTAACPVGYFKSVWGPVPCSVCPSNSRTSQEGSIVCECRSGFYRAAGDDNSSACTSESLYLVLYILSSQTVVRLRLAHRSTVLNSTTGGEIVDCTYPLEACCWTTVACANRFGYIIKNIPNVSGFLKHLTAYWKQNPFDYK